MYTTYEKHNYLDPDFPIFFHLDKREKGTPSFHTHWHEHIELLFIEQGGCTVCGNGIDVNASEGDIVMITPNCIHDIEAIGKLCRYYCITVDKGFCDSSRIPMCAGQFAVIITDRKAAECFKSIIDVMEHKPSFYKEEAKVLVMQLMIRCCRDAQKQDIQSKTAPVCSQMAAKVIDYMRAHFSEPITIDEISLHVGFSKYYVCHKFKSETGKTVIDYLNFLRCTNAKRLIASGKYNMSESARLSGFNSVSYFSKTYLKQIGYAPSTQFKNHTPQSACSAGTPNHTPRNACSAGTPNNKAVFK